MSLYQTHRPGTLPDVWGNEKTVKELASLFSKPRDEFPHALLFSGPSGCGKTTLARIIATTLECYGRDFSEVDTADFRGIDQVRDIRKKVYLAPSIKSKCRVWLLDECHKMTNDAQNAILKALEDAPAHTYFILCTTEPEKLLKTIRSRCTPFSVQTLSTATMVKGLSSICSKERKRVSKAALEKIAVNSAGHVRAAVVALDKIIDLSAEDQEKHIMEAEEEEAATIELCRILLKRGGWISVSDILTRLNAEPESTRCAIAGYARACLNGKFDEAAFDLLAMFTLRKYIDGLELWAMCAAHVNKIAVWDMPV